MAHNPKRLRRKGFHAWYKARLERAKTEPADDVSFLGKHFLSSRKLATFLYRVRRNYERLTARWTVKGFRGHNADGQWLRRTSKRRKAAWNSR